METYTEEPQGIEEQDVDENADVQENGQTYDHPVTASTKIDGEKVEATLPGNPGDSLEEAIEMYGKDTVFDLYQSQYDQRFQNAIRAALKQEGVTPEDVKQDLQDWRPDKTRRRSKDPSKSVLQNFAKLDPEEQEAMLRRMAEKAGLNE